MKLMSWVEEETRKYVREHRSTWNLVPTLIKRYNAENAKSEYVQTANRFIESRNITLSVFWAGVTTDFIEGGKNDIYRVEFSRTRLNTQSQYETVKLEIPRFHQSVKYSHEGKFPPTAYDILAALQKYNPGTFRDFCAELGYDDDSMKALQTYNAVCEEWERVRTFFSNEELEELQEIQ